MSVMYGSLEGNGHRTPSEAYPRQALDLATYAYKVSPTLAAKYGEQQTPFGTPVVSVLRVDGLGVFASKCGECGEYYGVKGSLLCGCDQATART